MIMELMGPNLEELFNFCGRKFSLKTVLMLTEQLITRIEFIHSKGLLYCDIKPENFTIGLDAKSGVIHAVEFTMCKRYKDEKTQQHILYKENKTLIGAALYSSINAHLGIRQTRRDDLEALGYMLIYFLKGKLPWKGLQASDKAEKCQKIMEKKMTIPIEYLCFGFPMEFATYFHYCRSLRFNDRPDYGLLKKMMRELMNKEGFKYDYLYDWTDPDPTAHLKDVNITDHQGLKASSEEKKLINSQEAKQESPLTLDLNLEDNFKAVNEGKQEIPEINS